MTSIQETAELKAIMRSDIIDKRSDLHGDLDGNHRIATHGHGMFMYTYFYTFGVRSYTGEFVEILRIRLKNEMVVLENSLWICKIHQ